MHRGKWSSEPGGGCAQRAHQVEGEQAAGHQDTAGPGTSWSLAWCWGRGRRQASGKMRLERLTEAKLFKFLCQIHLLEVSWEHVRPLLGGLPWLPLMTQSVLMSSGPIPPPHWTWQPEPWGPRCSGRCPGFPSQPARSPPSADVPP